MGLKSKGVRLKDKSNRVLAIDLKDILYEVNSGVSLYWALQELYGMGNLLDGKSMPEFSQEIKQTDKGYFVNWTELCQLAQRLGQVDDLILVGARDQESIRRPRSYNTSRDRYETCDYCIDLISNSYWEVFSKDHDFINRLAHKFKDAELLESDFLEKKKS